MLNNIKFLRSAGLFSSAALIAALNSSYSMASTWSYTYDGGKRVQADGPRDDVLDITQYQYDSLGNLVAEINALGHVKEFLARDTAGQPLAIKDANGVVTEFEYDYLGRLIRTKVLPPLSSSSTPQVTEYEYYPAGSLKRLTPPGQGTLTFEYDVSGRLTSVSNSLGERIEYVLDLAGNPTKQSTLSDTGAIARTLSQTFDELSRTIAVLGNHGQSDGVQYDAAGNPVLLTSADQSETRNSFDAFQRLTKVTDPLLGETKYAYDSQDRVISVTDANGNTTTYTYDAFGNKVQIASPDTGSTTFEYDPAGNRTKMVDARGVVKEYSYDALNRLVAETYPDSPSENVTLSYDDTANGNFGTGRLTEISRADVSISFVYDHLGYPVQRRQELIEPSGASTTTIVGYQRDDSGRLVTTTYPSGREVRYAYDGQGRISSIESRESTATTWQVVISNVSYLPFGPVESYSYGNGLTHELEYDIDYRLTGIGVSGVLPLLSRSYLYDLTDNITGVNDGLDTGKAQTLLYDKLGRITHAEGDYGVLEYTYDLVGNRLSDTRNGVISDYSYEPNSNRLLSVQQANGSRTFTHDAAGNRLTGTAPDLQNQSFSFNSANRLSTLSANNTLIAQYRYNPLGERLQKVAGGSTERYHYTEEGNLLAVTDGSNQLVREYIYWEGAQVALVLPPSALLKSATEEDSSGPKVPEGQGIEVANEYIQGNTNATEATQTVFQQPAIGEASLFYIHSDHLSTPQVVTNQDQAVVWAADYEPFGQATEYFSTVRHLSRFPGQYEDPESGLYYNYFRDYDPSIGRYIQSDPIGLGDGPNTYSYVHNNPLSYSDPSGQNAILQGLGLAGRICFGIGACRKSLQQATQSAARGLAKCLDDEDEDVDCFDVMYDCQAKLGGTRHWGRPNTSWEEELKRCISDTAPKCVEELGL